VIGLIESQLVWLERQPRLLAARLDAIARRIRTLEERSRLGGPAAPCPGSTLLRVLDPDGNPAVGADVTVREDDEDGDIVLEATTGPGGWVRIEAATDIDLWAEATLENCVGSDPCTGTLNTFRAGPCAGPATLELEAPPAATVTFHFTGCASLPVAGVEVTFNGETETSDVSGNAVFPRPANGTYPLAFSRARFASFSGTFTLSSSGNVTSNRTLGVASGYHCLAGLALPVADTLYLTDPAFGEVELHWGVTSDGVGSVSRWSSIDDPVTANLDCWESHCAGTVAARDTLLYHEVGVATFQTSPSFYVIVPSCSAGFPVESHGYPETEPDYKDWVANPAGAHRLHTAGAGAMNQATGSGLGGLLTVTSFEPFAATVTFDPVDAQVAAPVAELYGTGSQTWTVSE
jgi:hypothetical protein